MEGRQATASPRAARACRPVAIDASGYGWASRRCRRLAGLAVWGFSGSSDYPEPSSIRSHRIRPMPPGTRTFRRAPGDGAAMIVDAPATAGEPALPAPAARHSVRIR
jgi:hypothetical protein